MCADAVRLYGKVRRCAKHRLANVRTLAARYETQTDLAVALGMTKSALSQLIGPNPIRDVSERMARKFEKRLRLALCARSTQEPKNPTGVPRRSARTPPRARPGPTPRRRFKMLDTAMRAADGVKPLVGAPIRRREIPPACGLSI